MSFRKFCRFSFTQNSIIRKFCPVILKIQQKNTFCDKVFELND